MSNAVRKDVLPSGLPTGQQGLSLELSQGLVVGHDGDRKTGTHQVVPPSLERDDDGEEFLFVDGVPSLGIQHLLGQIGDGLQSMPLILLKDRAGGESTGVHVNDEGPLGIRKDEHGLLRNRSLEALEGSLLWGGPLKLGVLFREVRERHGNAAESLDELSIVSCCPKESADVGDFGWCGPIDDSLHLVLHHADAVASHLMAEELDFLLEEVALALFRVELALTELR